MQVKVSSLHETAGYVLWDSKVFENEAKQLCRQLGIFFVHILVERVSERDRERYYI